MLKSSHTSTVRCSISRDIEVGNATSFRILSLGRYDSSCTSLPAYVYELVSYSCSFNVTLQYNRFVPVNSRSDVYFNIKFLNRFFYLLHIIIFSFFIPLSLFLTLYAYFKLIESEIISTLDKDVS